MRNFDFAPLYRSTVGFDQIANLMDRVLTAETSQPSYPPYNIEKLEDDAYRISIAVAGFSEADLSVEVREKSLIVSARKADDDEGKTYLHRGIATRAFERRFHLADHVVVSGGTHADGMLHIELELQVPDVLKPRQIQIASNPRAIAKDVVDTAAVN
ncbi:Hsp20 family protein [Sulfitobacter sp.]|uniref:Hsp20 family protein n=1 Tax=Sulfitobacter sp. TaxID=1903071 RepID=UPI0030024C06